MFALNCFNVIILFALCRFITLLTLNVSLLSLKKGSQLAPQHTICCGYANQNHVWFQTDMFADSHGLLPELDAFSFDVGNIPPLSLVPALLQTSLTNCSQNIYYILYPHNVTWNIYFCAQFCIWGKVGMAPHLYIFTELTPAKISKVKSSAPMPCWPNVILPDIW